jgi:phosphinothricin acetyltransferase
MLGQQNSEAGREVKPKEEVVSASNFAVQGWRDGEIPQSRSAGGPMSELLSSDGATPRRAIVIRAAIESDMAAVRDIYAHYVLHSLATFEETPPMLEDMLAHRRASIDLGLPYLVPEGNTEILGFAYAALYRARPAYRFTIEDSVYVADGLSGQGIGAALLGELIARCERGPWRQMIAIVGDSANSGSIALHRRFGFELTGTLRSVGFKFDRWVDTPIMQRALGADGD